MTLKAEKFEELLTQELSSAIEPQRGKALAAFRAHLAEESQRPVIAGSLKDQSREISRKEFWFWSCVPSLAAACLAVVVTLKMTHTSVPVAAPANPRTNAADGSLVVFTPRVEQTNEVTRREEGVLVDGQGPQRVIREEKNRTTEWQDKNAIYRLSQPQGEAVKYEQIVPF